MDVLSYAQTKNQFFDDTEYLPYLVAYRAHIQIFEVVVVVPNIDDFAVRMSLFIDVQMGLAIAVGAR